MPNLVPDDCSALLLWLFVSFFSTDRKPGRQIRLTAVTGEERSKPSSIFAPDLLLSFTQLVKIFYCTCASHSPVP